MTARGPRPDQPRVTPVNATARIARIVEQVFSSLTNIHTTFLGLAQSTHGGSLSRDVVAQVRPALIDVLHQHGGLLGGTGLVLAPGALTDAPRWLEWWLDRPVPLPLRVNLHSDSAGFFDYTAAEWYREAQRSGHRWVAGPYVDYLATNEYVVTLTLPVHLNGGFLGVIGADLLASQFEDRVVNILARMPGHAVLVNRQRRVLASNTSTWLSGVLIDEPNACARRTGSAERASQYVESPIPNLPWTLLHATMDDGSRLRT